MNEMIANRKVIGDSLISLVKEDPNICIVVSDSRGSASLSEFASKLPEHTIEVGIAEQNLVGIAAGLAHGGKKPFVASPACFLTMRSIEQIKLDVAYSNMNVKLIGISAGVSYGALGMSHHSLQDLAVLNAIPNLRILVPADGYESEKMMATIVHDTVPTYIRIGRNAIPQIHSDNNFDLVIGKAMNIKDGEDLCIIATGETVHIALQSATTLDSLGISTQVINIHTIKPIDEEAIITAAKQSKAIITLEEHSVNGGLGSIVASILAQNYPVKMRIIGIPDEITIGGTQEEIFTHYGISEANLIDVAKELLLK